MIVRRIAYGLLPGVAFVAAVGTALGQGMQTFSTSKWRSGIARPTPSYGSTHPAAAISSRVILGTGIPSAGCTFAKLRPTKTACTHGRRPNEHVWQVLVKVAVDHDYVQAGRRRS